MITIVLTVSRSEFLDKVITGLELLDCDIQDTNLLCIVDGDDALYVRTRNLVNSTKFNERLTMKLNLTGAVSKFDINMRRRRISAAHNMARKHINARTKYVFCVEDDTTFGTNSLRNLLRVASVNTAIGMVEGVELGRWGVPYVGGWIANDIYDTTELISIDRPSNGDTTSKVDAGGLYCALIRADFYRDHVFFCDNGLGPDINLGLSMRKMGYENYILWSVGCNHHYIDKDGKLCVINPKSHIEIVTMRKKEKSWKVSY